jgi:transcriptional regulator with XRE-family HTH domain
MPASSRPRSGPADKLIGTRIRLRRREMGMTQADLGASLDPPRTLQQIYKYEVGINRISSATALQMCKVLKLPIAELLGIEGPVPTTAQFDDAMMMAIEMQKLSPKQRRALLKFAQAMTSQ